MSAFIVTKAHIDAMVEAGLGRDPLRAWYNDGARTPERTPDEVGAMLWEENHRSVNDRYNENDEPPAYYYRPSRHGYSAVVILKAIACYEYQSCEHKGWEGSDAKAYCDVLRARMIRRLPGFEEAPWGIPNDYEATREAQARARR